MFISGHLTGHIHIFGQYFLFTDRSRSEFVPCVYTRHTGEHVALIGVFIQAIQDFPIGVLGEWPAGNRWRSWKMRELEGVFLVFQENVRS